MTDKAYPELPKAHLPRGGFPDLFREDQMYAYADAARRGWGSPEEIQKLRSERYTIEEIANASEYAAISAFMFGRIKDELLRNRAIAVRHIPIGGQDE